MQAAKAVDNGTIIRVSSNGQVVGEVKFTAKNRICSRVSRKSLKALGLRVANAIILIVAYRLTHCDEDIGNFIYHPKPNKNGFGGGKPQHFTFVSAANDFSKKK